MWRPTSRSSVSPNLLLHALEKKEARCALKSERATHSLEAGTASLFPFFLDAARVIFPVLFVPPLLWRSINLFHMFLVRLGW